MHAELGTFRDVFGLVRRYSMAGFKSGYSSDHVSISRAHAQLPLHHSHGALAAGIGRTIYPRMLLQQIVAEPRIDMSTQAASRFI